jgi:hypothetical protein
VIIHSGSELNVMSTGVAATKLAMAARPHVHPVIVRGHITVR